MTDNERIVPVQGRSRTPEHLGGWDPFASLHREIDHLFNAVRGGLGNAPARGQVGDAMVAPAVDISEKNGQYELTAELPGLDPENVEVKLAHGRLTIKGEKKEEKQEEKEGYYLSERRFGSFQRSFSIPDGVDVDQVAASFKHGVLTVTMPKMPEAQQKERKITVQSQ